MDGVAPSGGSSGRRTPLRGACALHGVGVYGLAHALVDASCAALVWSALRGGDLTPTAAFGTVLAYNLLAFAAQPLLGWSVVDVATGRMWARAGAVVTAAACIAGWATGAVVPAIAVAGLANAAFHVGGGVVSLRVEPRRATATGIFVAPGAAGLAIGAAVAHQAWLPAVILMAVVPLLGWPVAADRPPASASARRPTREVPSGRSSPGRGVSDPQDWAVQTVTTHRGRPVPRASVALAAVALLLGVVALRALIGGGLALAWRSEQVFLLPATAAVVMGKAAGGVLADRFGREVVGVGALCLSWPALAVGATLPMVGLAGLLLFNMTMPVTVAAVADVLEERPGFAFGLTCLALAVGSLPALALGTVTLMPASLAAGCLASAAMLLVGLRTSRPRHVDVAPAALLGEV